MSSLAPPAPKPNPLHAFVDRAAAELSAAVAAECLALRRSIGQRFRWQFRTPAAARP